MILVTGGTGLVGSHLLYALLLAGKQVRASKRPNSDLDDVALAFSFYGPEAAALLQKINWVDVDLQNPADVEDLFEGITSVFHCAACVSFLPQQKHAMILQNVQITANLVNAALHAQVQHFAHVSSVAALGRDANTKPPITESAVWKNGPENSNYALSKYLSENEVWRGIEEGLPAAIVNPAIVLGAGNWHKSSNVLFKKFSNNFKFYSLGQTAFVDVRDVVAALLLLHNNSVVGQRYILASESIKYKDIFTQIAHGFGKKPPQIAAPAWLGEVLWRVEYIRSLVMRSKPVLTKETARSAQNNWVYSSQKIAKEFGFSLRNMNHTIEDLTRFYKNSGQST